MEYPRFVFICPGANKCGGGTYDHELVQNEKDHKAALDAGFSDTVTEALASVEKIKAEVKPAEKPETKAKK